MRGTEATSSWPSSTSTRRTQALPRDHSRDRSMSTTSSLRPCTMSVGTRTERAQALREYEQMLDEMRRTPGVRSVGGATTLPIAPTSLNGSDVEVRSRPPARNAPPLFTMVSGVTAEYFETLAEIWLPPTPEMLEHRSAHGLLHGRVGDDDPGPRVADVVGDVDRRQALVDAHAGGAQVQCRQVGDLVLGPVTHREGNGATGSQSECGQ